MIKGGIGGGKTITGLRFENRISIKQVFEKIARYEVKGNDIYFNNKKIGIDLDKKYLDLTLKRINIIEPEITTNFDNFTNNKLIINKQITT